MGDKMKELSIKIFNMLKNTINGGINCTVNEPEDKLYIEINRLGVVYKTVIDNISDILDDQDAIEREFDKVVKKYRSFINHKFFY